MMLLRSTSLIPRISQVKLSQTRFGGSWEEREKRLLQKNILGFVPTPEPVVRRVLNYVQAEPGMRILEPSAGLGNIADALTALGHSVDVIEMDPDLRSWLAEKKHNVVGQDFLAFKGQQYDRIVMNPPFEDRRDIQHVLHAYSLLKPGGRIVAVVSENAFRIQDMDSRLYRELVSAFSHWLFELKAKRELLPAGSFLISQRPAPVDTRIIVVDKPLSGGNKDYQNVRQVEQAYRAHRNKVFSASPVIHFYFR